MFPLPEAPVQCRTSLKASHEIPGKKTQWSPEDSACQLALPRWQGRFEVPGNSTAPVSKFPNA